jgi:DNA-binding CsgD family transcriptional regulator
MARTPYRIELSESEERELRRRARQQTRAYREVLRAKIVLLAAEGLDNAEIARRLDTTREAVSRWRKRFHEERLQGLEDRPRAGRPRRFSPRGGGRGEGDRLPAAERARRPALPFQ